MATVALSTGADFEVFETDFYNATLQKVIVEDKQPDMYHTTAYKQLRWGFSLDIEGRDDAPSYSAWTSLSLHEKSKLPGLLLALGVDTNSEDFDPSAFDPEELIGRRCRINIEMVYLASGAAKNKTLGFAPLKKRPTAPARPAPKPSATARPFGEGPDDDEF